MLIKRITSSTVLLLTLSTAAYGQASNELSELNWDISIIIDEGPIVELSSRHNSYQEYHSNEFVDMFTYKIDPNNPKNFFSDDDINAYLPVGSMTTLSSNGAYQRSWSDQFGSRFAEKFLTCGEDMQCGAIVIPVDYNLDDSESKFTRFGKEFTVYGQLEIKCHSIVKSIFSGRIFTGRC